MSYSRGFDPRMQYDSRGSERYDERGDSRGGSGGGYSDGRYRGGPGQHADTRVTVQVSVGRSEPDPRRQYGGSGSERCGGRGGGQGHVRGGDEGQYAQRHERSDERDRDRRHERDGSSDYERDYERRYRDHGEYGGGSQRDSRGGEYEQRGGDGGRLRDHGGGGYDRGGGSRGDRYARDARKYAERSGQVEDEEAANAVQDAIRSNFLEDMTRVEGEAPTGTLHARVQTTLVSGRMALPGAGAMRCELSTGAVEALRVTTAMDFVGGSASVRT